MSAITPGASTTATTASRLPFWVSLKVAVISCVTSCSAKTTMLFAIVFGTKAAESDKDTSGSK